MCEFCSKHSGAHLVIGATCMCCVRYIGTRTIEWKKCASGVMVYARLVKPRPGNILCIFISFHICLHPTPYRHVPLQKGKQNTNIRLHQGRIVEGTIAHEWTCVCIPRKSLASSQTALSIESDREKCKRISPPICERVLCVCLNCHCLSIIIQGYLFSDRSDNNSSLNAVCSSVGFFSQFSISSLIECWLHAPCASLTNIHKLNRHTSDKQTVFLPSLLLPLLWQKR